MRETPYKAKRINWKEIRENNCWIEGYLLIDGITGQYFIHASGNSLNESSEAGREGCLDFFAYEADGKTVCKCTGLPDMNGNKIWENDIVKIAGEDGLFLAQWEDDTARFVMENDDITVDFNNYWSYELEVVGNIFDNPELLK